MKSQLANSSNKFLSKKREINLFEAFAGIGSQHMALKNISGDMNWNINVVGIVEWFIDAIIAYESIHNPPPPAKRNKKINNEIFESDITLSSDSKKALSLQGKNKYYKNSEIAFWLNRSKNISNNHFDITKVEIKKVPKNIDIFTYSFPCQDLSGQGLGKGMAEKDKTRSGLLWEIDRIISGINKTFLDSEMPKYLLLENVKAMISKKHYNSYKKWLNKLQKLGYESKEYVLNSKNFGMAQARERVFVLSVHKSHKEKVNFDFRDPHQSNQIIPIKSILEKSIPFETKFNQYSLKESSTKTKNVKKYFLENYTNFSSENMIFDINYNGPTLTASGALSRLKLYYDKDKIRIMTPRESFRYMGFKDEDFDRINNTNLIKPNKQIYLAGNAIVIQVLEEIFRTLVF